MYPGAGLAPAFQYDGEHGDVADGRDDHEYAVRDDGDQVALVEPQVVRQRRLVEHGRVGHVVQVDVHLAPRPFVARAGRRVQCGLNVRVHQVHRHDKGGGGGGGGGGGCVGGYNAPAGHVDVRRAKSVPRALGPRHRRARRRKNRTEHTTRSKTDYLEKKR